jgi:hypothetical protein
MNGRDGHDLSWYMMYDIGKTGAVHHAPMLICEASNCDGDISQAWQKNTRLGLS